MAMDHAIWVWNHLPKQNIGLSPLELFTTVWSDHSSLNHLHIWGCPGYVLEPKLQTNGASIPKWNKRSRLGQFLGFSPYHSTKVAMMRNVATGNISPQFHVVFDYHFETVSTTFQDPTLALDKNFSFTQWQTLLRSGTEKYFPDDAHPPPLSAGWDDPDNPDPDRDNARHHRCRNFQRQHPLDLSILEEIPTNRERERERDDDISFRSSDKLPPDNIHVSFDLDQIDTIDDDSLESSNVNSLPLMLRDLNSDFNKERDEPPPEKVSTPERASDDPPPERASNDPPPERELGQGQRKMIHNSNIWNNDTLVPDRNTDPEAFINQYTYTNRINNAFLYSLSWIKPTQSPNNTGNWNMFSNDITRHIDNKHHTWESPHPLLLFAKTNDEDNPKWHQTMNGSHQDQFHDAMDTELSTLKNQNTWTKVKHKSGMNVIKSTWAFKVKRYSSGLVRKFKARFCV